MAACTVCAQADIASIHAALEGGLPVRTTAKRFSLSPSSLHRHVHKCWTADAHTEVAESQESGQTPGVVPLDDIEWLWQTLCSAFLEDIRAVVTDPAVARRLAARVTQRRVVLDDGRMCVEDGLPPGD